MPYFKYDGAPAAETAAPVSDFYGTGGLDTLTGTAAAESFWGGQGDLMVGGGGDDTYWLKAAGDRVVEAAGGGTDRIVAWTSVKLGDHPNVENLLVAGDQTYGAGDAGDNVVEGGAGAQQIYGGGGQDVLVGGAGADTFIVVKGEGDDVIQDFDAAQDVLRLKAGFTSFAQVQAHLSQQGGDVKLDLGDGDGLIFRNLTLGQLTAANVQLQLDPARLGAQTFGDEFDGLSLWDAQSNPGGTWRTDYGYQGAQGVGSYTLVGNDERQIYTSPYFRDHDGDFADSPFTVNGDGTISITARASANPEIFGYHYTSGLLTTQPTFAQTYGYFEMRADLPDAQGAWPAFWLIPADGSWPPELDVMETLTYDDNATWSTSHSSIDGHSANGVMSFVPDTPDGFHTYGALWTPTDISWYIDGVEVFHTATPADMNKPMFMIANLALGGWGGAIDPADLPAKLTIDYIRAYALGDAGPSSPPADTPPPEEPPVTGPQPTPPPAATPGVELTSATYADSLTGGAGDDTLNAGQGPDQLTGGAGADTFAFANTPWNAGHITDFQVGVDRLDLSALYVGGYSGTDPVADGYLSFESDGAGGARVLLDIDGTGAADPWPFTIAILDGVSPTGLTAADVLGGAPVVVAPPPPPGLVLTSAIYADTLTGGAGGDTLNAGQGPDRLVGGDGADHFAFGALPWNAGHVADFTPGSDVIDLRQLFADAGYAGSDPVADGYLKFESDGVGGAKVLFDTDGPGAANPWPFQITTLDGVAPSSLSGSDWLYH